MPTIETINPATGKPLRKYDIHKGPEIEKRLESAHRAFHSWRAVPFAGRARILAKAADVLEARAGDFASLMTAEMGKPISASEAEVRKCAWVCRHYAEHAEGYLKPKTVATDASRSFVRYDPIGTVLAVMPWNYPFWQVFRFAAPALMAGNTGLLKHASNVSGCSLAIEETFRDAGLPPGCFQSLLISSGAVAQVIKDHRIAAVTLTGSEAAGRSVASTSGAQIKKTVLELGGSDPLLVLADADVAQAARAATLSRMLNAGQSCIAAKRLIVHRDVEQEFVGLLVRHVRDLRVGDPMDPATEIGPLAREDLIGDLQRQVKESCDRGARAVVGGDRLDRPGYYFAPTVLVDVRPDHAVATEETFGPVAAVMSVSSEEDAIALANQSPYGIGTSLWTRDLEKADRLVPRIEAGAVFVNGLVKSDPRLPFGGIKRSGYGRELGSEGIQEFVNAKTVWIA